MKNTAFFLVLLCSCARVGAPVGGTKDITPPALVSASPPSGSVNFAAERIVLTFDEYVKLNNVQQHLLISPALDKMPEFRLKNRSLIIEFKSPLQANTTYNLNFGDAIADVNEGNILKNFRYVFSTGPVLDTLEINGTTTDAYTGAIRAEISVLLYAADDDSILHRKRPLFLSRSDEAGNFRLSNLPEGVYRVLAINDKNRNFAYDPGEELAFADTLVSTGGNLALRIYAPVPEKLQVIARKQENSRKIITGFSRPCPDCRVEEILPQRSLYASWFDADKDTLFTWVRPENYGIPHSYLVRSDSGLLDTLTFQYAEPDARLQKKGLTLKAQFPSAFSHRKLLRFEASEPFVDPAAAEFTIVGKDSAITKARPVQDSIPHLYKLAFQPGPGEKFTIIIPEGLTGIYGTKTAADTIRAETFQEDYFGNLQLNIRIDTATPALLVFREAKTGEEQWLRLKAGLSTLSFEWLEPGQYILILVIDSNQNGKWDPGDFSRGIQPERVIHYKEPVNIRSNWDMELDWVPGITP